MGQKNRNYNGLSERNHSRDGRPYIVVNNTLLFAKVDGLRICNLRIRNQRWWAMNFLYCRNGHIHDIDFCSDATYIKENGELGFDDCGKEIELEDCDEQVHIR